MGDARPHGATRELGRMGLSHMPPYAMAQREKSPMITHRAPRNILPEKGFALGLSWQ